MRFWFLFNSKMEVCTLKKSTKGCLITNSQMILINLQRQCSCKENTIARQKAQVGEKASCSIMSLRVPLSVHRMLNSKFHAFLSKQQIDTRYKTQVWKMNKNSVNKSFNRYLCFLMNSGVSWSGPPETWCLFHALGWFSILLECPQIHGWGGHIFSCLWVQSSFNLGSTLKTISQKKIAYSLQGIWLLIPNWRNLCSDTHSEL